MILDRCERLRGRIAEKKQLEQSVNQIRRFRKVRDLLAQQRDRLAPLKAVWQTLREAGVLKEATPAGVAAAFSAVDASLEEASRNLGASPWTCFRTVTLPLATPGLIASAIFVFLESLDEFTGTFFVGVPDVTTLPLLMFNATMGGNYQISSITALLLLIPRTSSLGLLLGSAFWGGAICLHMSKGDAFVVQSVLLLLTWVGAYLRVPGTFASLAGSSTTEPPIANATKALLA